jgi:hydrogenase maturation protease
VLCLGNELVADDAFGFVVAAQLKQAGLDAVFSPEAGLNLLEAMEGVRRLIVVDTILTGAAPPGTMHLLSPGDLPTASGAPLHYLGLLETLALARELGMAVPSDVVIVAVEAADCTTVGGPMTPAVKAAIPAVVDCVRRLLASSAPADA